MSVPSTPPGSPAARAAADPPGKAGVEAGRATRQRLLEVADRLFAEKGFRGTSMRAITRAAGVSVSSANYHFGSKQELLRESLVRRIAPVNADRIWRLDALDGEAESTGRPLSVEAVLEAFLRPAFEDARAKTEGPAALRQLAARLYWDPPEVMASLKRELFAPVIDRVLDGLEAALPDRSREELALRFLFSLGSMVHLMTGNYEDFAPRLERHGPGTGPSREEVLQQLIAFAAAGMRGAPPALPAPIEDESSDA